MSKHDTLEVIHRFSRREAINDGILRDVSPLAKEAGFVIPVAITSTVWAHCVSVPERCPWQDETGRLWDVLWMLRNAIQKTPKESTILFTLSVQNSPSQMAEVTLKTICSPGDKGEPVLTVMFPDED